MSGQRRRSPSSSSEESDQNNGGELPHTSRRDDNSISFRQFLQQPSDVVPTANPRRQRGKGKAALVDLVDVHGGLPDFVQDHLAVEAQLGAETAQHPAHDVHPVPNSVSPLDLALINEMLPNLMNSSQQRQTNNNEQHRERVEELGAFGPVPLGVVPALAALPDFLSDGPMHCDASNTGASSSIDTQRPSGRFVPNRNATGSLGRSQLRTASQSTDALLQQITRLEHEVQGRDRRIRELENTIFEQKAELVGLYEQIADQQNNAQPSKIQESASSRCHLASARQPVANGGIPPIHSERLQEIAARAESLLCDLFQEIRHLKSDDS